MARLVQDDRPWLDAMSEQRLILDDGCTIFANSGLVSDVLTPKPVVGASADDAYAVAKGILASPCPAADNLDQIYKFRKICISSK
jgi:hypothetical protein